jgi:hypothetical protein
LTVLALVAWRLVAAALTPLTFDEAYYRMWSKHLASGYYDHPPMVALVNRLGTMISGDTEQPGSRIFRHRALFTINFHYKCPMDRADYIVNVVALSRAPHNALANCNILQSL